MPGRLVVTEYVSLDGVIEDPVGMEGTGLGDWTGPFKRGPEGDSSSTKSCWAAARFSLAAAPMRASRRSGRPSRTRPGLPRSSTACPSSWPRDDHNSRLNNSTVLKGSLADEVRSLKDAGAGDILVYGSAAVVHA